MLNKELNYKYEKLKAYIRELKSVAVAFSSGVDSTFLLKTAQDVLGENLIAITASSYSFPKRELNEAVNFCNKNNIKHIVFEFNALEIDGFKNNPKNRCYLCKKELFTQIKKIASANNTENIIEGSNIDDNMDYRPGLLAISELGILSPLRYAEFNKNEIRILSKELNLPTSNKQSFACLASRFVYGETITKEKLIMIDKAEQLLFNLGFNQVRVRLHGLMARIEINPNQFEKLIQQDTRNIILSKFKEYGFTYVSMDLKGYRTGSMNETECLKQ